MKIVKTAILLSLSFILFSCASTPAPVQNQPEEQTEIQTEDNTGTEDQNQEESQPELSDGNDDPEETEEDTTQAAVAESPVYEPIEDIQGYYESDPEPAYLEAAKTDPEEEEIDIPIEEPQVVQVVDEPKEEVKAEIQETAKAEEPEVAVAAIPEPSPAPLPPQEPVAAKEPVLTAPEKETNLAPEVMPVEEVVASGDLTSEENVPAEEVVASGDLTSEENVPAEEEKKQNEESKIVVVPSRSVEMKNSQYLDIVYPGTGWIYLGEEDGKNSMRYFGRKIGEKNTVFSLRSREEGSTILHFYKNDSLTGKFIDDYLQVDIKGMNKTTEHAVAPSYAEVVPPKPENRTKVAKENAARSEEDEDDTMVKTVITPVASGSGEKMPAVSKTSGSSRSAPASSSKVTSRKKSDDSARKETPADNDGAKTLIQNTKSEKTTSSGEKPRTYPKSENFQSHDAEKQSENNVTGTSIENTENMGADEILDKAKESFKNKKYEETLAYLENFFTKATTKIDEGLWIQGQVFESNSSVRNIKSALDTYETIVRRYPQSINWAKANERITYLRKFYFNIR